LHHFGRIQDAIWFILGRFSKDTFHLPLHPALPAIDLKATIAGYPAGNASAAIFRCMPVNSRRVR
jgi:hypothetical protein